MKTVWTETGGARVGKNHFWSLNASWPFGQLTADPEGLQISYSMGRLRLARRDISRIELVRGLFSKGLRFEHSSKDVARLVVFWSRDIVRLTKELGQLGYGQCFGATLRAETGSTLSKSDVHL